MAEVVIRSSAEIAEEINRLQEELAAAKLEESQWPKLYHVSVHKEDDETVEEYCREILLIDSFESNDHWDKVCNLSNAAYEAHLFFEFDRDLKPRLVGAICGETIGTPEFLDKAANPDYDVYDMNDDHWRPRRVRENKERLAKKATKK